jgi:hypothetical protein
MARLAGVDGIVTRAFTGHTSDDMRERYSSVGHDEKAATVGKILKLVQG